MSRHTFRYRVDEALAQGREVALRPEDSHHLTRVVRRRPKDTIELIDRDDALWPARILELGPPTTVEVVGGPEEAPAAAPIRLYLGLLDWGRLDVAFGQLTELGVPEVVLFSSARSGRVPGEKEWQRRSERLDRVAEAAARQSGAALKPSLRGVVPFGTVLEEIAPGGGYLLHPAAGTSLHAALSAHSGPSATLIVGPEAGFAADELDAATAHGLRACGFGARVLRTGTAAVAAASVAIAALGGLDREGKE